MNCCHHPFLDVEIEAEEINQPIEVHTILAGAGIQLNFSDFLTGGFPPVLY